MGIIGTLESISEQFEWERTDVKAKITLLVFLFFCAVYVLSTFISPLILTYKNLRMKEKIFWNLAIVRGVYGFFCIFMGTWAIFIDTELVKDVVFATTPLSNLAMSTTVGFFLFEVAMITWSDIYYRQFNFLLNLHHWISLSTQLAPLDIAYRLRRDTLHWQLTLFWHPWTYFRDEHAV